MSRADTEAPRRRRLFLALYPTSAERRHLLDSIAEMSPGLLSERVRPVPIENLHMTLVFLGSVDRQAQDCVERVASTIECPAVTVVLDRLGYWPRKRMLWAIPDPSAVPGSLSGLVETLHDRLAGCEVTLEQRTYRPHVTLARQCRHTPRVAHFAPVEWRFGHFALMESVSTPAGVRYPVLRTWPLHETD